MRVFHLLLAGTALTASTAADAADQLKFENTPPWVVLQTIPQASAKNQDRPVALLLHDQQTLLEPGKISTFAELAFKIQKPEGLAAGNLSVGWNPATDTVTVNKLEIHRGEQVIDVLKSGQTFTTMRRESNLEMAMLDGMLTANIQPEGLQEGDIVVLATTTEHVDPVLKGHVEATFAPWGEAQIGLGHARLAWPSNLDLKLQKTGELPSPQQTASDGRKVYELTVRDVEPVIDPKSAPVRFKIGRMGEATDFRSWADAARLLLPLFRDAAVIPPSGVLREEVEKIRSATNDPKLRAEQALQLVQERVRYVALLMGQGSLVPAAAETTWARRFGDCKAKTALLLGILHELGIDAEPIAVNPIIGDAIAERLPMIALFNHVLVRARIGGKTYYLDGTRSGDGQLDDIEVPNFGWGLPLIADAKLVSIVPPPRQVPNQERHVDVDASAGVYAPATIAVSETYRGDSAVELNTLYSALSTAQKDELLRKEANQFFDGFQVGSSSLQFDKAKRQYTILIKGTAKLNWNNGWFYVPTSSIAFTPDFSRPAGRFHDAPIEVNHPRFAKDVATFKLPAGFAAQQKLDAPVHETLAGVEYARTETLKGEILTVESSERSVAPEVTYKEALAAAPRLKALDQDDTYLRLVANYRPTEKDVAALSEVQAGSASELVDRGNAFMNARKFDQAIADFTKALAIDPKNVTALADRALAHVWKHEIAPAEADLTAAQAIDPDNAVLLRARGLIAEQKDDCRAAIDSYSKSLQIEPSNSFALGHRAICERAVSKDDEALADSERALKTDPSWIDLRVLRANILFLHGNRDAVASEAALLTQENPGSDYAYVAAGKIYSRIGKLSDSLKQFDKALAIKPQAYIYLNRAQSRAPSDRSGRLADIEAALRLEPNDPDTLAEKAEQLASDGDFKGASQLYERVAKAYPDELYPQSHRAAVLFKAGNAAEARKIFTELHAKAKSANDFNTLCWAKATSGILLQEALNDCREALKRAPNTGGYLDSLALVELRMGKIDEAIADYGRAIANKAGSASYMGRALAYSRKGDRARANADLAQALKLDPNEQARFEGFGLRLQESSATR
jgi:tetratricopeptide (TPR) repeat protein